MLFDRATEATRERAALRLRLAGAALGTTLLVLSPDGDRPPAAAAIVAYLVGALILRAAVPRYPRGTLPIAGLVLDILYASVLVGALPFNQSAWALFAFAIGTAAHRYGAWGAVASTAAAITSYDLVLAVRAPETDAAALWPIQAIVAIGLLCVELVFVITRTERQRTAVAAFALAQRELAAARGIDDLLSRVATHAVATCGASGAAIKVRTEDGTTLSHLRGEPLDRVSDGASLIEIPLGEEHALVVMFGRRDEHRDGFVHDLATDARPLLAGAIARRRQRRTIEVAARVADMVGAIVGEAEAPGIAAQLIMAANSLGGAASLLRRSDGAVIAGEPLAADLVARLRDLHPPAVVPAGSAGAPRIVTVSAGPGLALVFVAKARGLEQLDVRVLETIGATAGAVLARVNERDALAQERAELRTLSDRLQDEIKAKDESVASAVHEMRTPLTTVTAYGQVISRNLQTALQQLAQLDRLIGDLRGAATAPVELAITEIDLSRHAKEAAQRQRITSEAVVDVRIQGEGPFRVRADSGRVSQVLDNILGNAVKFSPRGSPIEIAVERRQDEVLISVSDEGPGLAKEDLERIFERYYRARTTAGQAPGLGIGLAVTRDIVQAHGGRVWAESAGAGKGSTFFVALPALPVPSAPTVR